MQPPEPEAADPMDAVPASDPAPDRLAMSAELRGRLSKSGFLLKVIPEVAGQLRAVVPCSKQ